jgi:hypothetical protein
LPAILFGKGKEQALRQITLRGRIEAMLLVERAGSDEIHGILGQPMNRGMRQVFWRQLGFQVNEMDGQQLERARNSRLGFGVCSGFQRLENAGWWMLGKDESV